MWWDGADAMTKAAAALDDWYSEVVAAQTKAADAIAKWDAADTEERAKKTEWKALSDDQRSGRTLTDTWTPIRNAAGTATEEDVVSNRSVTFDHLIAQLLCDRHAESRTRPETAGDLHQIRYCSRRLCRPVYRPAASIPVDPLIGRDRNQITTSIVPNFLACHDVHTVLVSR